MNKTFVALNVLAFICTIVNLGLGISYELKMSSLFKATEYDNTLQYDYLYGVLCHPCLILQVVVIAYDVCYYTIYILCQTSLFGTDNKEIGRSAGQSKQDNRMSNLLIDFLFFSLIKGLALGLSFFYAYESIIEIDRMLAMKQNTIQQQNILNSALSLIVFFKWFILAVIIYVIWTYIIRGIQIINKKKAVNFKSQEKYAKLT